MLTDHLIHSASASAFSSVVVVRQELCTSDHKPVYANFGIAVPKQLKQRIEAYNANQPPACAPGKRIVVALRFKSLSVEGLHELTSGGAPNPRVNFFGTHRGELLEDSGELQSHARMKTTEATWSPAELKKMRLNCPSVALLGGTCESPSLAGGEERVAHSEAITLRFSSVPDDYDNKTKESKWLSDAMRKAGDHMGVNVGLTWPELLLPPGAARLRAGGGAAAADHLGPARRAVGGGTRGRGRRDGGQGRDAGAGERRL